MSYENRGHRAKRSGQVSDYLAVLVSTLAAVLLGYVGATVFNSLVRKPNEQTLDSRISILTQQLNSSAQAIREIEEEVEKRRDLATKLQRDAEVAKRFSEMRKDQVEAVAQALRGELQKHDDASWWGANWMNFAYALLGVLLAELYHFLKPRLANLFRRADQ